MAKRINYQIVGRYMDGQEVTAYHLQSIETGKSGRYSREQVCYLVGRGQITNCDGQIYKDKVLLRGVGISLESLPVKQENGALSRTENLGKVRKGASAADAMTQFILTHAIVQGRNTVGYVVSNAGGGTNKISRAQLLSLAKAGRIGNARYQESNGKPILRGVGINLNQLPTVQAETLGMAQARQSENTPKANPSVQSVAPMESQSKATWSLLNHENKKMVTTFKKYIMASFNQINPRFNNVFECEGFTGGRGTPGADGSFDNGQGQYYEEVGFHSKNSAMFGGEVDISIILAGDKCITAYVGIGGSFENTKTVNVPHSGDLKADVINVWQQICNILRVNQTH